MGDARSRLEVERIQRLAFFVPGIPIQQGSKSIFNGRVVDQNITKLKPWRTNVTARAIQALAGRAGFHKDTAVTVLLDFYLPRGKTVKRSRPTVKPDLDKLIRSVLDSLTVAGVYADDAQVCAMHPVKAYADDEDETVGVKIVVTELA